MLEFITTHASLIGPVCAAVIAVIDLAFAVNPNLKSNGLLHFIYLKVGGKE